MSADPHAILRSKAGNLPRELIDKLSNAEAWKMVYQLPKVRKPKVLRRTVCFTGFAGEEAAPLKSVAEKKGYIVVQSVIKGLSILCTGPTPGPKKLEKAREQGARVLSSVEFIEEFK